VKGEKSFTNNSVGANREADLPLGDGQGALAKWPKDRKGGEL